MLSVSVLSDSLLIVVMLNVIMLSLVALCELTISTHFQASKATILANNLGLKVNIR